MASIRRSARAPQFAAIAIIFAVLASAVIAFALREMRADAIDTATVNAGDMATILAEDVANAAASLDLTLRDAADFAKTIVHGETISGDDAEIIRRELVSRRAAMARTDVIAVANASGDVVAAARDQVATKVNISDREYFAALRDERADGLFVSRPLISKSTGAWTIFFARRIEASNGRFLGVAFVGIEPAKLFRTHPDLTAIGKTSFSLFYVDGTVAMRDPDVGDLVGKPVPSSGQWQDVAARGGGLYHSQGVFDSYSKYVAVRPVVGYPLFVNVGITDEAALAKWRTRMMTIIGGGGIGLALVIGLLYAQLRLADRLSRSRIRSWLRGARLAAKSKELLNTRKRFGLTLDYISQGMAMFDANEKLVIANHCYAELYGLRPEQLRAGMDAREIFALRIANGAYCRKTPEEYLKILDEPFCAERLDYLENGRIILVREKETDEGGWVTVQEDVTERTRAAQELAYTALHDSLTRLPNRQAFKEHLAACVGRAQGGRLAILLVDIDGFKEVNDTYGHEVGDDVLIEVAKRLSEEARDCFVARLGGDEFVAMIAGELLDADGATCLAERLIAAVQQPINVGRRLISLGLSVGVNLIEAGEGDFSCIMRRADLALYAAKNGGRNRAKRFDEEMERQYRERTLLAQDLREAIEQGQLAVHYQPIVNAADRRIVCMEALARWRHPIHGMIPPATFIPIAEETGLIVALGNWVLRRACADAAAWRPGIVVAVNVSSLQIERLDFVETVIDAVEAAQLAPHRLQIEITESILLRNNEATDHALHRLRAFGVTFALDDFGTGFASLAYLKAFPLDKVKIDKSFVDDICLNQQSMAIVAAIVALAHGLDIETTAEGVETLAQYEALRAVGVATMQGYFFGKPKTIDEYDPAAVSNAGAQAQDGEVRAA